MPSLLDGPVVTNPPATSGAPESVKLAVPFNPAHIDAEFREERPFWRRVLDVIAAPFRWMAEPYWSAWDPHTRPMGWWPTLVGDMELPLLAPTLPTYRRCCSDHPDQL